MVKSRNRDSDRSINLKHQLPDRVVICDKRFHDGGSNFNLNFGVNLQAQMRSKRAYPYKRFFHEQFVKRDASLFRIFTMILVDYEFSVSVGFRIKSLESVSKREIGKDANMLQISSETLTGSTSKSAR
ncbi:unnamed protein product [Lathyrus oleraceus]